MSNVLRAVDEKHTEGHRLTEVASGRNMLLHGDNGLVLDLLTKTHQGKIKCAYLDPPYNNGESYLHYFDSMGHDKWLAQLTERLEIVKKLLSDDGSLWISIDDSEAHYLKVAADAVFGRKNFALLQGISMCGRRHRNSPPVNMEEVFKRYKTRITTLEGPWQSGLRKCQGGHGTASKLMY